MGLVLSMIGSGVNVTSSESMVLQAGFGTWKTLS
jgi:hypothetical protein